MKKISFYSVAIVMVVAFWACKKDGNYPGGTPSPYISILDLRNVHKGEDVTLTQGDLFGAGKIAGVVTSNHAGGNLPAGILTVQDNRRLTQMRGIAVNIGTNAANYVPGDSVIINIEGGVLKRVDGLLQLTGISNEKITKVASGRPLLPIPARTDQIAASPGSYESVLVTVNDASFDPSLPPGSTFAGNRVLSDGYGSLALRTEPSAAWANRALPLLSKLAGIVFSGADGKPQLRLRSEADITVLNTKIAAAVIAGYLTDPSGTDANYEYIQLLATKDIDFAATPFSIVTTNNAGASTPQGFPVNGWATGDMRTYKINLTSGTVAMGQYFYVGANKNIWGAGSTDISSSKWFVKQYSTVDGDGFGTKSSNLLANSGNAAGIAVFDKTTVDASTVPVDVIFFGGSGSVYTAGPPERGYRITSTDYYAEKNPANEAEQPYFLMGTNINDRKFAFPATTNFAKLGGKYNKRTGRWTTVRTQTSLPLTLTSQVSVIEGGTTIDQ